VLTLKKFFLGVRIGS